MPHFVGQESASRRRDWLAVPWPRTVFRCHLATIRLSLSPEPEYLQWHIEIVNATQELIRVPATRWVIYSEEHSNAVLRCPASEPLDNYLTAVRLKLGTLRVGETRLVRMRDEGEIWEVRSTRESPEGPARATVQGETRPVSGRRRRWRA